MVNTPPGALDAVFSALADPTRRRIIERLARRPMTVGELGAGFSISQPGISKHVRALEECGLLERDVVGRVHRCSLSPKAMRHAASWMERQYAFWTATLDRLGDVLDEPSTRKKKK
jgi:DNA-binding transcriptional ArsR family regulator